MNKEEFVQELKKYKLELAEEVIIHYREGNEERGNLAFNRWEERFVAFLRGHAPAEADRFRASTYKIALVAIRNEHPLERFMRQDGNTCLAFIDELAESVMKGRVGVQEQPLMDSKGPAADQDPSISNLTVGRLDEPLIVVITALEEELDYLLDMPLNWSEPLLRQDGISYRHGHFTNEIDIIATSARGMGLVATAIITVSALKEWRPLVAAMIGVCGGRKEKDLNIGDIVVPNQCFHYQFGAFKNGKIERDLRVENTEPTVTDIAEHLILRTEALSEIQKLPPRGFKKPSTVLKGHVGPMASADLVVKDIEKLGEAVEADRKTIAVDMESYAFMRAARAMKTRHSFVIKAVSDFADAKKDDEYREYAKFTSAQFFFKVAQNLVAS